MAAPAGDLLVNIDVPDLDAAERFYVAAFGLTAGRRFTDGGLELIGWPARVYLLERKAGTPGAGGEARRYARHWCPVHMDVVVPDIGAAVARAQAAGAVLERGITVDVWGKLAVLGDPFGHGFCLIEFLNRGYDEIAIPAA